MRLKRKLLKIKKSLQKKIFKKNFSILSKKSNPLKKHVVIVTSQANGKAGDRDRVDHKFG